ncbi:MAG: sterol desaturase family protein [Bacteroidota bacterium]
MSHNIMLAIFEKWWWALFFIPGFAIVRYLLSAGSAFLLCYYPGVKFLKKFKIQPAMPKKKQIRHELIYSFSTVFIFSVVGIAVYFLYVNGYTTLYTKIPEHGWGYLFISLGIMLIIHDGYFYWTHRLLHTKWFFKKVHIVHHRSINPTPLAAYSFHPLEALLESLIVFPFIIIFPVHIIVFLFFTFLVIITNVIGHLGFEFVPKKIRNSYFGKLLTFSTHHNLHHQKSNKNFGYYFTVWDKIMKTLQHDANKQGVLK